MAVPKRKTSKMKSRTRRASNWRLESAPRSLCDRCQNPKRPHTVCSNCGWYHGRQAIEVS